MLKEIGWNSYWLFIATTVAFYYCILFAFYKFKERLALSKEARLTRQTRVHEAEPEPETVRLPGGMDQGAFDDFLYPPTGSDEYPMYACVDEVNAYLEEARKHRIEKDELIRALAAIVAKYPSIKETEYKESLSSVMTAQSEHLCFIHLSAADMDRIWQS